MYNCYSVAYVRSGGNYRTKRTSVFKSGIKLPIQNSNFLSYDNVGIHTIAVPFHPIFVSNLFVTRRKRKKEKSIVVEEVKYPTLKELGTSHCPNFEVWRSGH